MEDNSSSPSSQSQISSSNFSLSGIGGDTSASELINKKGSVSDEVKFLRLLGELREALQYVNSEKEEINKFRHDNELYFSDIKSKIERIYNIEQSIDNKLANESKLYKIILIVSWWIFIASFLSFFIVPVIAFIFIYFLSPEFVLSKFELFLTGWATFLTFICGIIFSTGLANLYRLYNNLKNKIDKIDEKQNR